MSYTGVPDLFDDAGKIKAEKLPTSIVSGDGKSAYEVAVENGYTGNETQWLLSLKGTNGKDGKDGIDGVSPTLTKEAVEQVLIGEVTSHSHQSSGGLTQAQIRRLC